MSGEAIAPGRGKIRALVGGAGRRAAAAARSRDDAPEPRAPAEASDGGAGTRPATTARERSPSGERVAAAPSSGEPTLQRAFALAAGTSGSGVALPAGRALAALVARARSSATLRDVWSAFWVTRALTWAVAVAATTFAGSAAGNRIRLDVPGLTHPFGGPLGALFSSFARWDAVWYLGIAHNGYTAAGGSAGRSTAFFPLYPALVRVFSGPVHSPAALLVASYVVSLAAFAAALVVLHKLVTLELGRSAARTTVLLLAVFPASLYFGAPYSESVFLLMSVGAFYAARTGRFAWAGCLAAGASATRSEGILLMLPLAVLYLYGPRADRSPAAAPAHGRLRRLMPRHPLRRDIGYVALAPLGLAVYSVHLALSVGDGFAYMHLEHEWYRGFAGPFGGALDGARAALDGILQLASGSRLHHYFPAAGGDPFVAAGHNLTLFVFLAFAAVAVVGVARRLPLAYSAYLVPALALPLSFPVATQPLMSLPRFESVMFPIFMWLALACRTHRRRELLIGAFALGLGVFTVQFATWHWVA